MTAPVYLDYNATAPARPEVRALVAELMDAPGNASSVHAFGRRARMHVERARAQVAALAAVRPEQVVFGSGATEANNTVLYAFRGRRVLVSAIEHPSVLEAAPDAGRIPVTTEGVLDLAALEEMLAQGEPPALVSIMLANNETGAIQPVALAAALAKKRGALVHCDAVQAAGRVPLDMAELGADFLTLSAHKIGGPQGAGALILGFCGETPVLLRGGGQERRQRAGTENVAGIAGFGLAAELAVNGLEDFQKLAARRDGLETELKRDLPELRVFAAGAKRLANTSMISLPGRHAKTLLIALDLAGIAVSDGSACSSGRTGPSHVLQAMGAAPEDIAGALRVSMGRNTTAQDLDRFAQALRSAVAGRGLPVDKPSGSR